MTAIDYYLALPDTARVNKRVAKKLFFEHVELTATDRRAFTEDIEQIHTVCTLTPGNVNVQPFADDDQRYPAIAVFEVTLRANKRAPRLAECIHRAIPDPLLLVISHDSDTALSTAPKRTSRAEAGAIVVEETRLTHWFDPAQPAAIEQAFLDSLALSMLPHTHLYAFYHGWHRRLLALACARLSGQYRIPTQAEGHAAQREQLALCHQLDHDIARLRAAIKKETRFNEQVALNTRIKALETERQAAVAALAHH